MAAYLLYALAFVAAAGMNLAPQEDADDDIEQFLPILYTVDQPPPIIHFFWAGDRQPNIECILQWAKAPRAKRAPKKLRPLIRSHHDWEFVLWTKGAWKDSSDGKEKVERLTAAGVTIRKIDPSLMKIKFRDNFLIKHKVDLQKAFKMLLKNRNFPAASDVYRYFVMYAYGGSHIDVDICPGELGLSESIDMLLDWNLIAPRFAPSIRTIPDLDNTIETGLKREWSQQRVQDFKTGMLPHMSLQDKILLVQKFTQIDQGIINNGFISIHKGSEFMLNVLQALQDKLKGPALTETGFNSYAGHHLLPSAAQDHPTWLDVICYADKGKTISVTGPNMVVRVYESLISSYLQRTTAGRLLTEHERKQVAEKLKKAIISRSLLPLQWLTDDSDNI